MNVPLSRTLRERPVFAAVLMAASSCAALAAMSSSPSRGWAGDEAAPTSPAPVEVAAPAEAGHERSMTRLLTMDHHLAGSDFIGEVRVSSVQQGGEPGSAVVELEVKDTWYERAASGGKIAVRVARYAELEHLLEKDARLVVLVSGAASGAGVFTFGNNSVFRVGADGAVTCTSGNPLFAVHNSGFVCSVQSYMPAPPIGLVEMRDETKAMRERAAARLPEAQETITRGQLPGAPQASPQSHPEHESEVSR